MWHDSWNNAPTREIPAHRVRETGPTAGLRETGPMAGRGTPATVLLDRRGISYRTHSYPHRDGAAYGPEAAEAPGLDPTDLAALTAATVAAITG